jgi:DNA-binding transcriptional ArsR family regulator
MPTRVDNRKKSPGVHVAIVRMLRNYKGEVPVGFLAREVGRSPPEVRGHLRALEKEGIVRLRDDSVCIV